MRRRASATGADTGSGTELSAGTHETGARGVAEAAVIHRRLAAFYFCFYGVLGAFLPYWALWLAAEGLAPVQIGMVFGTLGLSRIVVPVFWGWLADRSGAPLQIVRVTGWLATLCFAAMAAAPDFHWMLAGVLAYAVFWHACLPLYETVALDHLQRTGYPYPRVRLWGSVGFVLAVVLIGAALQSFSIRFLPVLIVGLMVAMTLSTYRLTAAPRTQARDQAAAPLAQVLRQPAVLALLAVCFLSQLSFAPYYGFFSVYLQAAGYSPLEIGGLWAWGVVAEILIFLRTGELLGRFGAGRILVLAMLSTGLRWGLLPAVLDSVGGLVVLQTLHLASFGLYHAAAIVLIRRYFAGALQSRGQALYSAVSFGLGGALGGYCSGWLWTRISPDGVFWLAALAGAVGALIAYRWLCAAGPEPTPGHSDDIQ